MGAMRPFCFCGRGLRPFFDSGVLLMPKHARHLAHAAIIAALYADEERLAKFREIEQITVYKNLENKETAFDEVSDREAAIKVIDEAINRYIDNFCK